MHIPLVQVLSYEDFTVTPFRVTDAMVGIGCVQIVNPIFQGMIKELGRFYLIDLIMMAPSWESHASKSQYGDLLPGGAQFVV